MLRAEGVGRALDHEEASRLGGSLVKGLGFGGWHGFVVCAVHDQPGRGAASGGSQQVVLVASRFEILADLEADRQLLAGTGVENGDLAGPLPRLTVREADAVEGADRRPRHQSGELVAQERRCCGEQRRAAATAVPEEAEPMAIDPPGGDLGSGRREDRLEVLEVAAESGGAKSLEIGDQLVPGSHSASEEVEPDGGEAARGEELGKARKEAPVHEALESVTDHDRGSWTPRLRQVGPAVEPATVGEVENEWFLLSHAADFSQPDGLLRAG